MKRITALCILIGLATVASADEKKGLYVGLGVGQFDVNAEDIDDLGPIIQEFDSNATTFKVFGGWRFNPYVSVELAWLDLGSPEEDLNGTRVETDISGFAPYITGSLPIGPLEVFAKVGYLFYDLNVDVNGQEVASASGSQDDFIYGIGAGMILFKRLEARLEYEYLDASETIDDGDALWLSAVWRF